MLGIENKDKVILDLCGGTGAWSKPYKDNGYTVYNITLPYHDINDYQFEKNILRFWIVGDGGYIEMNIKDIYGILAAPPCTMFSIARTKAKTPRDFREGMKIIIACLNIIWGCRYRKKLHFWCLENPRGFLRQFLGKPAMTFQPCQFGDEAGKFTDLWGYFNLPKIKDVNAKPIKGKYNTESLWYNKVGVDPKVRAITPPNFARAFYEANK